MKAKFFRGLADLSRLGILEALGEGPMTVSQIAGLTGLSQPNTSMHLDCLWCCGLVERESRGRFTFYWIGTEVTKQVLELADSVLMSAYDRIAGCDRYRDMKILHQGSET